ncbi:MAG: hypothetical protein WEC75_03190 [Dehalococcoidia bacterium]
MIRGNRAPGRIGTWRLFDLMQATMHFRGWMVGGAVGMPEYGPPDVIPGVADPAEELPDSNISEGERRQAVERERSRRFLRTRRMGV